MEFHFLLVKQKKVAFQKPVKTFRYLYARSDLSTRSFVFVEEQPKEAKEAIWKTSYTGNLQKVL